MTAHELTHSLRLDLATGDPREATIDDANLSSRIHERTADVRGTDLALRTGFSPRAMLGNHLVEAMYQAFSGPGLGPSRESHPAGLYRYEMAYRQMNMVRNALRKIHDGKGPAKAGAPYMSEAMKREFDSMPTPKQARAWVASLISEQASSAGPK